jgi:group I intron endonuclease
MVYGIIYKYESPSRGIYIGQTIQSIEKRNFQHINDTKNGSNRIFHNAVRKYGIETFKCEILHTAFSKEELNDLEIYYIEKYNSYYKNSSHGYNMTVGGEGANGYVFTKNDRKKLSFSLKQYYINNPNALTEMSRRASEYNNIHPEKSKIHSDFMKHYANLPANIEKSSNTFKQFREENPETISIQSKNIWQREGYKEKMSNKQKDYLSDHPEEKNKRIKRLIKASRDNAEKHSEFMKELLSKAEKKEAFKSLMSTDRDKNPEKYKIANKKRKEKMNTPEFKENMALKKCKILNTFDVYDKNGNLIGDFNNTFDCIKTLNLPKSPSIVLCLNNKLKQSQGYIFKYK